MSEPFVMHVVGARPNFPKLAPVYHAFAARGIRQEVVHTGQHYDDLLSDDFFRVLEIPEPDVNLGVGSGSHAVQTARVMERIEPVLAARRPEWLMVYGDVNSTVAASLVAAKLAIRVAHVEAGLRSFDRSMPEEINRLLTDRLSSLLLTPSRAADRQLLSEGEAADKIVFVGNVMIDTLLRALPRTNPEEARRRLGFDSAVVLVTLHRPSNVDDAGRLARIGHALATIAEKRPVLLAAHPRTQKLLAQHSVRLGAVRILDALPYLDMLALMQSATVVITDSGGVQEETTVLGVPCLTLRYNTERPITIEQGTNRLVPEPEDLVEECLNARRPATPPIIEGWDGSAGARVAAAVECRLETPSPLSARTAR